MSFSWLFFRLEKKFSIVSVDNMHETGNLMRMRESCLSFRFEGRLICVESLFLFGTLRFRSIMMVDFSLDSFE